MDETLNKELGKEEKLLWKACPEAFDTLDATYKKHIIRKMVTTCAIVLAIMIAYLIFALTNGGGVKIVVIGILVLVAVCASINSFTDAVTLKKAVYAVTDKRIIIISDSVKSVELDVIGKAAFKKDDAGHYTLLCGSAIDSKPTEWRNITVSGPRIDDETKMCTRFALYAVPEHEKVKNLLSEYITF